jgi:hypothetical protein
MILASAIDITHNQSSSPALLPLDQSSDSLLVLGVDDEMTCVVWC